MDLQKTTGTSPPVLHSKILLLEVLDSLEASVTEKELLKRVVARREYKIKALRLMVAEGKVVRIGSGKKADPYRYSLTALAVTSTYDEYEEVIL